MDLDGHMVSSINLICVCLCFASSFFAKSWFPKIDKICKFFLEKGLVPRNLMLGEEKSSARELFSRKKYPPAERPPNYGDKGVFCGKSQILMFFCVWVYHMPYHVWPGWAGLADAETFLRVLSVCRPAWLACFWAAWAQPAWLGCLGLLGPHTYTLTYIPTYIHIYILPYLHTYPTLTQPLHDFVLAGP